MKNSIQLIIGLTIAVTAVSQGDIDLNNDIEAPQSYSVLETNGKTSYFGQTYGEEKKGIGTEFLVDGSMRTGYFENDVFLGEYVVSPPWHIIDIEYDLSKDKSFENYSIDLTIDNDIPNDAFLYIAVFCGEINNVGFYGGIQTQCGGYKTPLHNEEVSPFYKLGRAGIFSRWGTRDAKSIRKAADGLCESSGYEGDFVSVRNHLNWNKGTYTLSLTNTHETVTIDSVLHSYVEMKAYSHRTREEVSFGKIAFPGEDMVLAMLNRPFVEHYCSYEKLSNIPKGSITLSDIEINDQPQDIESVYFYSSKSAPQWARSWTKGNTIEIQFGEPYVRENYKETDAIYYQRIK